MSTVQLHCRTSFVHLDRSGCSFETATDKSRHHCAYAESASPKKSGESLYGSAPESHGAPSTRTSPDSEHDIVTQLVEKFEGANSDSAMMQREPGVMLPVESGPIQSMFCEESCNASLSPQFTSPWGDFPLVDSCFCEENGGIPPLLKLGMGAEGEQYTAKVRTSQ